MPNIKALTYEELCYMKEEYSFSLFTDEFGNKYVCVNCKSYPKRNTLHPITESFHINTPVRKVVITRECMNFWIDIYKEQGYSLIEVQDAINKLKLTYQNVGSEDITKRLSSKKQNAKIVEKN